MSPIDAAADAWVRALIAGWAVGIVVGRLPLGAPSPAGRNLRGASDASFGADDVSAGGARL